jgi:Outer membrane protein beta-barrel domain
VKSLTRIFLAAALFAPLAAGQTWEAGVLGGFGITPETSVTSAAGSASTGFKNGGTFGIFGGANDYSYIGGEASYLYRLSDLKVASGGTQVNFAGHTQFLDFRFLVHFASREKRFRPFVALGGGVAIYSGTGEPNAAQPLNNFVALTNTRETKPMASGAAGIKYRLTQHLGLRFEFRDYATPFPNRLISPAPGVSLNGWLQNFEAIGGIAGVF